MLPYGVAVSAFIVARQRSYVGPDARLVRLVLMCVTLAVLPAGANDLLMTMGAIRSVLLVDVASSLMVLGLGYILSRRAQDAYVELVSAIDKRRAELARGAADVRTTSRTAALGAEVTRVLGFIREPVRRIVSDLVSAEDAVLAVPANGDPRWLEEREVLAECRDAASRVQKTVAAFAELSDAGSQRASEVDVRVLIDRALSIVGNEIRHRARLVKEIDAVPLVVADADRLVQAFVSLFVRALRAIPQTESASGRLSVKVSSSKGRVFVRVSDNGAPIPESLVPLVFDPYIAEEPESAGSGLGLALCHRIVTRSGGRVTVESRATGTDVLVELPSVSPSSRARGHQGAPASPERQVVGMQIARPDEP